MYVDHLIYRIMTHTASSAQDSSARKDPVKQNILQRLKWLLSLISK